jgi:hypothetical protein
MGTDLHGVRVDTDGTRTAVTISVATMNESLRKEVGGDIEFAHYGTAQSAVTAVVHESGMPDGLPVNGDAETFVCHMRGGQLGYHLYGPVVFFGFDPARVATIDLTGDQRAILNRLPVYGKGGAR